VVIAIDVVVADVLVVGVVKDVVVDQIGTIQFWSFLVHSVVDLAVELIYFFQYQNCVETPRRKFTTKPRCERKICFQIEQIFKRNFFLNTHLLQMTTLLDECIDERYDTAW
jgi:hypothetical protein